MTDLVGGVKHTDGKKVAPVRMPLIRRVGSPRARLSFGRSLSCSVGRVQISNNAHPDANAVPGCATRAAGKRPHASPLV